eukprot:CAMPEP_0174890220 /NCGR_PEP_ID=MMETSP0167-20121228/5390_1 /TAXON_ID=38298 /ORGANISM="Rhodella maculata, Strain CCMP736" /LENGTH=243 /DNA_ID=CAMNT_0016127943 /DNA_START=201 /DNA_END=928 /DNA_ORIENTATION=-
MTTAHPPSPSKSQLQLAQQPEPLDLVALRILLDRKEMQPPPALLILVELLHLRLLPVGNPRHQVRVVQPRLHDDLLRLEVPAHRRDFHSAHPPRDGRGAPRVDDESRDGCVVGGFGVLVVAHLAEAEGDVGEGADLAHLERDEGVALAANGVGEGFGDGEVHAEDIDGLFLHVAFHLGVHRLLALADDVGERVAAAGGQDLDAGDLFQRNTDHITHRPAEEADPGRARGRGLDERRDAVAELR